MPLCHTFQVPIYSNSKEPIPCAFYLLTASTLVLKIIKYPKPSYFQFALQHKILSKTYFLTNKDVDIRGGVQFLL